MCGRFTLKSPTPKLAAAFPGISFAQVEQAQARYNVAPSQQVVVIPNEGPGEAQLFRWGLVPSWAKDLKIGYKLINARADTVASTPAFRAAFKRRHCAILADGFYEWKSAGPKQPNVPTYFELKGGQPFAFAGLWEVWKDPQSGELVKSCSVITTEANALVAPIHNRMPVILRPEEVRPWLDAVAGPPEQAQALLRPLPPELMQARVVSTQVNSVAHEGPELLAPA